MSFCCPTYVVWRYSAAHAGPPYCVPKYPALMIDVRDFAE
jgi:hypothetical protein